MFYDKRFENSKNNCKSSTSFYTWQIFLGNYKKFIFACFIRIDPMVLIELENGVATRDVRDRYACVL